MPDLIDQYAWADADHDLACTIAVLPGLDLDAAARLYGADPRHSYQQTPHTSEHGELNLIRTDAAVMAFENNGWTGIETSFAEHASRAAGRFFAVYWSPVATRVIEAVDGRILSDFEPLFIGEPAGQGDPLGPWVRKDDFPDDHLQAAMLAALERQAGVAFARAWLLEAQPTYRIPEKA